MKIIIDSNNNIRKLIKEATVNVCKTYRLMRYVFQTEVNQKTYLLNLITGQLIELDQSENQAIQKLPDGYSAGMNELIMNLFIVPSEYDEEILVKNLRSILRKLFCNNKKSISSYTILPTTACNARCYYCFEAEAKTRTMTPEIAEKVIKFIVSNNKKNEKIHLTWFGGEPTISSNRINQICRGLREHRVKFASKIITNGYLLDEQMIEDAINLWNLEKVQISVDGTEETYNSIKSYINPKDNPYRKVLDNIKVMVEKKIAVNLRMNFDIDNYRDFEPLLIEVEDTIGRSDYLSVYAYPVIGNHINSSGEIHHGSDEWFCEKIAELNDIARSKKMLGHMPSFPCLFYYGCQAMNDSAITITPEGKLVRCPEQFSDDQIVGDIESDIVNTVRSDSWKEIAEYDTCKECLFYPKCIKVKKCNIKENCNYSIEFTHQLQYDIKECLFKMDETFYRKEI